MVPAAYSSNVDMINVIAQLSLSSVLNKEHKDVFVCSFNCQKNQTSTGSFALFLYAPQYSMCIRMHSCTPMVGWLPHCMKFEKNYMASYYHNFLVSCIKFVKLFIIDIVCIISGQSKE